MVFRHFAEMGYSKLFRNRWFAIIWAAGILWFAYDVATESKEAHEAELAENAQGPAVTGNEAADMAKMVEQMSQ